MPTATEAQKATEEQKATAKRWREAHNERVREYTKKWQEQYKTLPKSIERIDKLIKHKQDLINMYVLSRSPDSPITSDDDI